MADLWYRSLGNVFYLATDHVLVDIVHVDTECGCYICTEILPLGKYIPAQSYGPEDCISKPA